MIKPFSEVALFEQGNSSDPFYATGSIASIGEDPSSFSSALKNKDQIRFSFPVKNSVQMLKNSASIYYYNFTAQQWNIPSKSIPDHVGPLDKVSFNCIGNLFPVDGPIGSLFIEDQIGFDCFGNPCASGTLDVRRYHDQMTSISSLGQATGNKDEYDVVFDQNNQLPFLTREYTKSIQRNANYDASSEELFSLNVDKPFLIEKVVIELPLCCGPGWFYDRSAVSLAYAKEEACRYGGSYPGSDVVGFRRFVDTGGPGITVSLFSQKKYGNSNIRDLICNTLITHFDDYATNSIFPFTYNTKSDDNLNWYLTIKNLGYMSGSADVEIITGDYELDPDIYFTGSVQVRMTPSISNGVKLAGALTPLGVLDSSDSNGPEIAKEQFKNLITTEYITPLQTIINSVDPFGRGMTGFSPSGGSIFGKEYVTSQGKLTSTGKIKNPYYISSLANNQAALNFYANQFKVLYTTFQNDCDAATPKQDSLVPALFMSQLNEKGNSPYLVNPGEKLLISISKHRPALKAYGYDVTVSDDYLKGEGTVLHQYFENFSSNTENGHDVTLNTGSINITFYGSYVRENKEYVP